MQTFTNKNTLLLLFLMVANTMYAIDRKSLATYATSLSGKNKGALKQAVYDVIKQKKVLEYGSGTKKTWWGFWFTDRNPATNECINRYSDTKFYFTSHDGNAIAGMNIEHSFPKSWWGGAKNDAYKDLYNLYPSDSQANSDKSNFPMGVVTTVKKTSGEGYDKVGKGDAGGTQVNMWEPGDRFKGEFSRSYIYMATAYQEYNWVNVGLQTLQNDAYPTLKAWASRLYLAWSKNDKVDQMEIARNNTIAEIQKNRNLFIDYPYLAEYIWGDSMDIAFDPTTSITTADDDMRYDAEKADEVATPVITNMGSPWYLPFDIKIECATKGATIYYTTDDTTPSEASNRYDAPFRIFDPTTVRAIAIIDGKKSKVAVERFDPKKTPGYDHFLLTEELEPIAWEYIFVVEDNGTRVAKPVELSEGKTYGYLFTDLIEGDAASQSMDLPVHLMVSNLYDLLLIPTADGYIIKDSKNRYYYQDQTYASFTPTDDINKADIWLIRPLGNAQFEIKAKDSGNIIQYSTKYKSFGAYPTPSNKNIYPTLYTKFYPTKVEAISEAKPTKRSNYIYNLQGIRFDRNAKLPKGIYIKDGRKILVR